MDLYKSVKSAIAALPRHFRSETTISGLNATDIFTLNQVLAATVEEQVADTLNVMRPVWDPDERYQLYSFERQAQAYPDVRLRTDAEGMPPILLGIELKGWYVLAKESEPSFRFKTTPRASHRRDLLAIIPWALSNVVSGGLRLFRPYIQSARYVAEYRNYWWQHIRKAKTPVEIVTPQDASPYPSKADASADRPVSDSGGNFGRLARMGIMDAYFEEIGNEPLCGIDCRYWRAFFKAFQDTRAEITIDQALQKLETEAQRQDAPPNTRLELVGSILQDLRRLIRD